jgi:hypothetical protein
VRHIPLTSIIKHDIVVADVPQSLEYNDELSTIIATEDNTRGDSHGPSLSTLSTSTSTSTTVTQPQPIATTKMVKTRRSIDHDDDDIIPSSQDPVEDGEDGDSEKPVKPNKPNKPTHDDPASEGTESDMDTREPSQEYSDDESSSNNKPKPEPKQKQGNISSIINIIMMYNNLSHVDLILV